MKYFLLALVLTACGNKDKEINQSNVTSTENLKYRFKEGNCDTGEHAASSKDQYCANLRDDALNNGCATTLRKQEFTSKGCAGAF